MSGASLVGGDFANIETGPAKVTFKTEPTGHTQGGVTVSVKPSIRQRKVDEFGENVIDKIHQGDEVTVKATFLEKTMMILQTVYFFGYQLTANAWSIGRRPGVLASTLAGPLLIHPLSAGDATTDDVEFYLASVDDVGDVNFGTIQNDRMFEATFGTLIDITKSDGNMICSIGTSHLTEDD